jgi:CBS-domain-containing membrane protein
VGAAELMTSPARTTTPGDTVQAAAQQMRKHRISRLPVVDPGTGALAGIVTRSDVLRVDDRPDADIERDVRAELADRRLEPAAEKIQVTVDQGRVEVRGEVDLRSQIPALMHDIRRVEGVVSARSDLTWDADGLITIRYPIT